MAAKEKNGADEVDPYGNSTDEDAPKKNKHSKMEVDEETDEGVGLPDLPDLFTDKYFYLFGDFAVAERRLLTRFIAAYNGYVFLHIC